MLKYDCSTPVEKIISKDKAILMEYWSLKVNFMTSDSKVVYLFWYECMFQNT